MNLLIKDQILVTNPKAIKILKKDITKRILKCFNEEPKTASQIANSISFPKDKIYYHIKNLISLDILFIAEKTMVKGIEQKSFLPTAKKFSVDEINEKSFDDEFDNLGKNNFPQNYVPSQVQTQSENDSFSSRKINDRRRNIDRRVLVRRGSYYDRRVLKGEKIQKEKRKNKGRRISIERRIDFNRRVSAERRVTPFSPNSLKKKDVNNLFTYPKKVRSKEIENTLLRLNGIQEAMTFVQSGNNVTYLLCSLNTVGFSIKRASSFELPIRVKDTFIKSLPELIINVFYQDFKEHEKKSVYLAIHSDSYKCEMTYLNIKGKSQRLFEKNLFENLSQAYNARKAKTIFDYERHTRGLNNATVSFTTDREKIDSHYKILDKSGIQLRYITTIPKILFNIYQYYNIKVKSEFSLLIYIGHLKTHVVFCSGNEILDSLDLPKGLNFFTNSIQQLNKNKIDVGEKFKEALHYLSYYGFENFNHESANNNIKHKDAKPVLEDVIEGFSLDLKDAIFRFENYVKQRQDLKVDIQQMFISGPGSHIKGLGLELSNRMKIQAKNLSSIIESHLVEIKTSKKINLGLFRKNNLLSKKENSRAKLNNLKQRITSLEQEIDNHVSPESAKYSIARLEIEKSRTIKSIELANKNLIKTSKEFKTLKKEFEKDQKELNSNLEATKSKLDIQKENLFNQYEEHEEINQRISELDFESDNYNQKTKNKKVVSQIDEGRGLQLSAHQRAVLNDKKESFEAEIDDLETRSLKFHEMDQKCGQDLAYGYEEVEKFQYLLESLKGIASIFKQSFLNKMKQVGSIKKEDILTLQQAKYLISKNTKRTDQIRDSFKRSIDNNKSAVENKSIDDDKGLEIKEKILNILDLIRSTPENLIHLKNQSDVILKINNDINKIRLERDQMSDAINKSKMSKREKKQAIIAVKNNIDLQEKDLKSKEDLRLKNLNLLNYARESIEMNDELDHHNNILKELKPRKKIKEDMLKEISLKTKILQKAIQKQEEYFQNQNEMMSQIALLEQEEEDTQKAILEAKSSIIQLEEKCISKKVESDNLKQKLAPIIEESKKRKEKILNDFDTRLKYLSTEESLKIAKVRKTINTGIKTFFKKEENNLKKEVITSNKEFQKIKREKEKIVKERISIHKSLEKIKKNKLPKVLGFKKQISSLEKDLKLGRRLQERLDKLELKKKDWDLQMQSERSLRDQSVTILEKSILRKNSKEYYSFIKTGLDRFENDENTAEAARDMIKESVSIDIDEIENLDKVFMRFKKRYDHFMNRYNKRSKEILMKLRPYGGKKKNILRKIRTLQNKVDHEENMIQKWVGTFETKNEELIQIEGEFSRVKTDTENKVRSLNSQIQSIPNKKKRAIEEAELELIQIPKDIGREKSSLVLEKEEALHGFDVELANHELTVKLNKIEDKILNYLKKIDQTNIEIKNYKLLSKKNKISKSSLELKVDRISKNIEKIAQGHGIYEDSIINKSIEHKQGLNPAQKGLTSLEGKLENLRKEDLEIRDDLQKIEQELNTSNKYQKDLQKNISEQEKILKIRNRTNSKNIHISERRTILYQFEKDLKVNSQRLEQVITEMSRFIDSLQNDQSELESEISLIDHDKELFERDLKRYETLLLDNRGHLKRLSTDYQATLNNFLKIKSLYPTYRIMINERIANLYSLIDIKIKDKDEIHTELQDINQTLKDRRIEMAMLDKEISKIHGEMKESLENSFLKRENRKNNVWKWEINNSKMKSYMDIAQLKLRSKELFDEIIETEKLVGKLKNDYSSMENVLSESEKINLAKIKKMEERCTRLEIQISKEKRDLDDIKKQVFDLEQIPVNQAERVNSLKVELKRFKDQEAEYELTLRDLDRSMATIQEKSQKILKTHNNTHANSISLDYIANLGLLMDSDSKLNLLPTNQKINLQYFRPNKIFQKALIGIVMVLSLGAFANRSQIRPLKDQLPIKKSELSLMTMRKQLETNIDDKILVASSLKRFIENDKNVSNSIVKLLQYVSNEIPKDFHVTDLKIKNKNRTIVDLPFDLNATKINVNVDGFYEEDSEKSLSKMKKFQNNLERTGNFKSVSISQGKKVDKSKSYFSIKLVY